MIRLLALPLIGAAILPAPAPHQPAPSPEGVEAAIFEAANGFRAENRLPALRSDAALGADARAFAEYLAKTGRFSHTADGRDPAERARAAGYDYCEIAENIAYEQDDAGFGAERLTRLFMSGWERSPGHRRNLLDPEVAQTGVGVARAPGQVQKYVAVQEFGRPSSMRFSFRVENRTGSYAAFRFDGDRRVLPPRATLVETTCSGGELVFEDVAGRGSRYAAEPGTNYVLLSAPGGVSVRIDRLRPNVGRTDRD